MTSRDIRTAGRSSERLLVNALWIAAGFIAVAGFVLRPLARYLGGSDMRFLAITLIALGLAVAALAWIGEKLIARKAE